MERKFKPYGDWSDEQLIDEYNRIQPKGYSVWLGMAVLSGIIAGLYIYLRLGFWIFLSLFVIWIFTFIFSDDESYFDKKRLLEHELKTRRKR